MSPSSQAEQGTVTAAATAREHSPLLLCPRNKADSTQAVKGEGKGSCATSPILSLSLASHSVKQRPRVCVSPFPHQHHVCRRRRTRTHTRTHSFICGQEAISGSNAFLLLSSRSAVSLLETATHAAAHRHEQFADVSAAAGRLLRRSEQETKETGKTNASSKEDRT